MIDRVAVGKLMRQAIQKSRGYADFWHWPFGKSTAEVHVALEMMNHLVKSEPELAGTLSAVVSDPPDVLLTTQDGLRIGIEVTELVDSKYIKNYIRHRKSGITDWGHNADWNPLSLSEKLIELIGSKDRKVQKIAPIYAELILLIHTDELAVDRSLVQEALTKFEAVTEFIDRGYIILSYDPAAARSEFETGYPIFKLPCKKVGRPSPI